MGWFQKLEEYLDPLLQIFRNTSVLALFPVFILVFGLGELSKSAIVFWGCIWPSLLNTISGVKGVDPLLIKSARSMGISVLKLFQKVILPAALPEIMTGIRLSAGVAIIILVAAEMLGATRGLGYFIFYAQQKYAIPDMYAGIVTISILGVLINFLLVKLENRIAAWKRYQA
jgi:NitT/TauT family transport system permease protein